MLDDRMVSYPEELITAVAVRAAADRARLTSPLDQAAIEAAQARLGFVLHPLLAAVYREVADGGFGPDYSLLSLDGEPSTETVVGAYLARRSAARAGGWGWPEGVLPILHWGCGMYACVDCRSDLGTVLLFEPNPGDPDQAWFVDAPSLAGWFTHYVQDTGWWIVAEQGGDTEDLPPWPEWVQRC